MNRQRKLMAVQGGAGSALAAPIIRVFPNETVCPEFLGVNGTYHGFCYMPFQTGLGMTDADATRELDRVAGMGLRLARTWYRPDWACGASLTNRFDWESVEMRAFYRWLEAMRERGVKVALQAAWWCSKDTYLGHDSPEPARDLPRFAEWVSESLGELIEKRGFTNITHLVLFTEPVNYSSGLLPAGQTQTQYYGSVIRAIHNRLVADNRRHLVRTVGPNSGSTTQAYWVDTAVRDYDKEIDVLSWHSYNGDDYGTNPPLEYAGWLNLVQQGIIKRGASSKPYWFDEYGANRPDETVRFTADYGNYLAQAVAAFINGGCQTSLLWILLDQKYPGNHHNTGDSFYDGVQRWGLAPWPHDDVPNASVPRPAYTAFGLMSRVLGGGPGYRSLRTEGQPDLHISAIAQPDGHYAFLVVNAAHTEQSFDVLCDLPLHGTLERFTYDPAVILPDPDGRLPAADGSLTIDGGWSDRIPARGVLLYRTMGDGSGATVA